MATRFSIEFYDCCSVFMDRILLGLVLFLLFVFSLLLFGTLPPPLLHHLLVSLFDCFIFGRVVPEIHALDISVTPCRKRAGN